MIPPKVKFDYVLQTPAWPLLRIVFQVQLPLGPKECQNSQRQRVLVLVGSEAGSVVHRRTAKEEWLVRPVAPVLQPRQQTLDHFVFARERELFKVLRQSGGESITVFKPFHPRSELPLRRRLNVQCSRDSIPFTGKRGDTYSTSVLAVVEVNVGV